MKDIKSSNILKSICYILVPCLVLIMILSAISIICYATEGDKNNSIGYIGTEKFAEDYSYNIQRAIRIYESKNQINLDENVSNLDEVQINLDENVSNLDEVQINLNENVSNLDEVQINLNENVTNLNEAQINLNENVTNLNEAQINLNEKSNQLIEVPMELAEDKIQRNFSTIDNYDILLITKDGNAITNVNMENKTDSIEEIKSYISNKEYFWKFDGQNIQTNIEKLENSDIINKIELSQYQIYTAVRAENEGDFYRENLIYDFSANTYKIAPSIFIISSILLISCMIYILISIGHKKEESGIYLGSIDKIPYEVIVILAVILFAIEIALLAEPCYNLIFEVYDSYLINTGILASIVDGILIYITIVGLAITTIRRIKAHVFWKNTFVYKLFDFIFRGLFTNLSQTVKLALQYGGFIIASFALIMITNETPIVALILLGFWYYVFKKILNHINELNKVREQIGKLYNGNIDEPLKEDELYGELRQVARELNNISGGLSNAIEEATKSERLKTELITNVSHDIKTPLTSIINYVDLMKKESIKNEKVQEYLNVLDSKSQRLKKLTEDLIEASKASSGNIKLTMEKLDVKELIKQVGGEFEDRFSKRGLEVIETFPEEDVNITADSRYLYRVMENVYSNISKYALENSRVYIDVIKTKEKVQIILKNISQDKLNISVDELMRRFVRGDEARTTEGSGLGISIAKSLTELQNGKFNIYLDGDLFKVVIEF